MKPIKLSTDEFYSIHYLSSISLEKVTNTINDMLNIGEQGNPENEAESKLVFQSFELPDPIGEVELNEEENVFSIEIPYGYNFKSTKFRFSVDNDVIVSINGKQQFSNSSRIDLSKPVQFTLTSSNGDSRNISLEYQSKTLLNIPETGIKNCYDDEEAFVDCENIQGFPNQEMSLKKSKPRNFQIIFEESFSGDPIIYDKNSLLTWALCPNSLPVWENEIQNWNCPLSSTQLDWTDAKRFCSSLNSMNQGEGYAGKIDWRLPELNELYLSIPNYGLTSSSQLIETNIFINQTYGYSWSNTEPYGDSLNVYAYNFSSGDISVIDKTYTKQARCVSGGQLTKPELFSINSNGSFLVVEKNSKTTWLKCPIGYNGSSCNGTTKDKKTHNWREALNYCYNLTEGNRIIGDWRLPSVNELKLILNFIDSEIVDSNNFPINLNLWSSNTIISNSESAYFLDVDSGRIKANDKIDSSLSTLCVTNSTVDELNSREVE